MESTSGSDRRAVIAQALAEGEWPWSQTLRTDEAFVDGICELAATVTRAGIEEIALAATVADEHVTHSALARLLLLARGATASDVVPRSRARERVECATLAEAFDAVSNRGIARVQVSRWVADFLGNIPMAAHAADDDASQGARALLRFGETPSRPAGTRALADALGADVDALDGGMADVEIVVNAPAQAALAAWLSESAAGADDVWMWPAPEAPRPVTAPTMTFSASRLNGFVKCPRRWFYDYLCDAVEDEGSAAATYGKVFHEALEALHREVRIPSTYSGNAILERLHGELDFAFERNRGEFASPLEFEVSRLKARAVAAHYARWLRAEASDHPMHVEAVESLQRWTMGGHNFVGYIDRIDRPEGGGPITVYDYKTGRIDEDPQAYVASIRRGEEAQLALYYTVRRMRGDSVGRLALVSLRDPRDPVWVLALDMVDDAGKAVVERTPRDGVVRGACTPEDMAAATRELLARCDLLTSGGLEHFEIGADPPCSYCAYASACRERPPDGERIFAR